MHFLLTVFYTFFVCSFLVFLPAISHAGEYFDRIIREKSIRIGLLQNSPPYSFSDEQKKQTGFEYDIAIAIAEQLNVAVTIIPVNHMNRLHKVIAEDIDISIANIVCPENKKNLVEFSIPYLTVRPSLLVHTSTYTNLKELKNMKIAVLRETPSYYLLKQLLDDMEDVPADQMIIPLTTEAECFTALKNHHVVAWFGYVPTLTGWKQQSDDFQLVGEFYIIDYFTIALPHNDKELKAAIDNTLQTLWKDGTYTNIYLKWFGPKSQYQLPIIISPFVEHR